MKNDPANIEKLTALIFLYEHLQQLLYRKLKMLRLLFTGHFQYEKRLSNHAFVLIYILYMFILNLNYV